MDVNGTLTELEPIGAPWARPELGPAVLEHAVRTAMVEALLGPTARPFSEHIRAAIEVLIADAGLDASPVGEAVAATAALPARPDAAEALAMLVAAGKGLVALTNSGARAGQATLEACGLATYVEQVLGVDSVSSFKLQAAPIRVRVRAARVGGQRSRGHVDRDAHLGFGRRR